MSLKANLLKQLARKESTPKKLAKAINTDRKKIQRALKELEQAGKIQQHEGVYTLAGAKPEWVEGTLVKLGASFGFVQPQDKSADIFVPGRFLQGAMPGDTMAVKLRKKPRIEGSREGEVQKILKEENRVIGLIEKENGRLYLALDNTKGTKLALQKGADGGAEEGEKVAGEIVRRSDRHDGHRVAITLRFGSAEGAKQCAAAVLYAAGVEKRFPAKVKDESKKVASLVVSSEEIKARRDLREEIVFTIDSASTKDIDDAISVKRVLDGYRLSVHIADVSHYVKAKSVLDEEAMARGTSIYYADNVVPMLPKALSNDICSLNEGVDRLSFSCIMTLDSDAKLLDYRFFKTAIRSRVKGVYAEINTLLCNSATEEITEKYAPVRESLEILEEVYEKLAKLRSLRGDIEIESEEPKLSIDEQGRCVGVEKRARGKAERMIEEFMLLANTAAAKQAKTLDIPFVYRVHDTPPSEKVEALQAMLSALSISFRFENEVPTQAELARLLNETRDTSLKRAVHQGVLRSMAKASYEATPKGHFGLALEDYAHFTSPIRRYPDLVIHRILSEMVLGVPPEKLRKKYRAFCEEAAQLSSERELRAQKIERTCDDIYKAEYMKAFLGEVFCGTVSSVTRFGIYVELENTVEGLIHVSALSDEPMELVEGVYLKEARGERGYRVGDPITVQVAAVNINQGNIDFVLAE